MMRAITDWLRAHGRFTWVVATFAGTAACIWIFNVVITPPFEAATSGYRPIDLQFPITVDLLQEQLPAYGPDSRRIYVWFQVVDFIFPALAGLFTALLWAWMVNLAGLAILDRLAGAGLLLVPFVPAVFDWLENVGFLILVFAYPPLPMGVAEISVVLREIKLIAMTVNGTLTGLIVVLALGSAGIRRLRGG